MGAPAGGDAGAKGVSTRPAGERVGVVVRVRPQPGADAGRQPAVRVDPDDTRRVQVLSAVDAAASKEVPSEQNAYGAVATRQGARSFRFDACLEGSATQDAMYSACDMSALVQAALAGYQVTVFAFGQTGAGKTHTISGPVERKGCPVSDEQLGLVARALRETYERLRAEEAEGQVRFAPRATFSEIYNEEVSDLLAADGSSVSAGIGSGVSGGTMGRKGGVKSLAVRHHPQRGFFVEGLSEEKCADESAARAVHERGLARRRTASHALNATSTRSHCLYTLHLDATPTAGNAVSAGEASASDASAGRGLRRFGRLCFVDLAGSERLKETRGTAARETGHINKSLFALGKCLAALSGRTNGAGGASAAPFVPFRESKLTQLLIDSLRGRGRALMVACCSPSASHVDETYNTLHFASLALHIKSKPVVILDPADKLLLDLRQTISTLRSANKTLLTQLEEMRTRGPPPERSQSTDGGAPSGEHGRDERGGGSGHAVGTPTKATPWRPPAPSSALSREIGAGLSAGKHAPQSSPMRREPPATRRVRALASPTPGAARRGATGRSAKKKAPRSKAAKPRRPATAENGGVARAAAAKDPSPYARAAGRDAAGAGLGTVAATVTPAAAQAPAPRAAWAAEDQAGVDATLARVSRQHGLGSPPSAVGAPKPNAEAPVPGAGGAVPAEVAESCVKGKAGAAGASFPTLDALEEQFRRRLAEARAARAAQFAGVAGEGGTAQPPAGANGVSVPTSTTETPAGGATAPGAPREAPSSPPREVHPEQRALEWAARNPWFGAEPDMTAVAYATHDEMVAAGVDTSSGAYYAAIEEAVRGRYPERFRTLDSLKALQKERRKKVSSRSKQDNDFRELSRSLRSGPVGGMAAMARAKPAGGAGAMVQLSLDTPTPSYPSAAQLAAAAVMGDHGTGANGSGAMDHSAAIVAAKQSHSDYVAKREAIFADLQQAKADAEAEREKIMREIRETLRNL